MLDPQEPPHMDISHKRKAAWAREIIQEVERYGALEGSSRQSKKPNPSPTYVALMCDIIDKEPTYNEAVVQKLEWVYATIE